jgi:transcriptional regulator with XRE-family HTH domain
MEDKKQYFSQNLTICCASYRSVSRICREMGINRPQFARYLKGASLPSASNLRLISEFFGVPEADFFLPEGEFRSRHQAVGHRNYSSPAQTIMEAFRGQDMKLKDHIGFYHSFYTSPSWDNRVVCSLIECRHEKGLVVTRGIERSPSPHRGAYNKTTYHGLMSSSRGHIYIVEKSTRPGGALCETIFKTGSRPRYDYLRGVALSVSWQSDRNIFTTPIIWKRIAAGQSARVALSKCGLYAGDDHRLPEVVRNYLNTPPETLALPTVHSL